MIDSDDYRTNYPQSHKRGGDLHRETILGTRVSL